MTQAHIIIGEIRMGRITQETYEAVSFARECSGGLLPCVFLPGKDVRRAAEELAGKTGCPLWILQGDHLEVFNAEHYCSAVIEALQGRLPRMVCLPHSSMGLDLAPMLAVKLGAACIPAVEKIGVKGFIRAVSAGRYLAEIVPQTDLVVVTVQAGAYPPYSSGTSIRGPIKEIRISRREARSRFLEGHDPVHRDSSLKDADVIVSAGRGIGKKENIALIRELASCFPRSAVGASRPVCDLGWMEHGRQVGSTGQTVAPKLYIACGISGAIQHVAGMKGAQTIVAINTDQDAAIFRVAHVCIVEDITTFIPVLVEELKQRSQRGGIDGAL